MGIFRPGKTGDAMGESVGQRPSKQQIRQMAKAKQDAEITQGAVLTKELLDQGYDPTKDKRTSAFAAKEFKRIVMEQRDAAIRFFAPAEAACCV